jgi:hypothetical protein
MYEILLTRTINKTDLILKKKITELGGKLILLIYF